MVNEHDFSYIRKLVYDNSAIVLETGKEYLVDSRINPLAKAKGFSSLSELVKKLQQTPYGPLHYDVIEAMTTNETSFFRDAHPFEAMKAHVLPEMTEKLALRKRLNIWSAACSSGQEPYSLAMLINDHFAAQPGWNVNITATDISEEMLSYTKKGHYTQLEINRGLPVTMMVKYFENHGSVWKAKDNIRNMLDFRKLNLSGPWPMMPKMDVIFLRNVLIYFDQETKRGILNKVRNQLNPEGYLFLGSAETTFNLDDSFERKLIGRAVCYQLRA
ncbi:MCP methyltransferase, CheR-type [Mariprofundus aestuarium]|uniref:Chemotaxis protein methyltransferase n=1 Tax=Mariprofundus aestuarium TaxID=1921086 RepID=A0A2K8KUV9_MARES|nr:protein-glutamate O-methyltransferase CheR [Mariprofundus aestuarium]ATX78555.1 MCP methyltransferase, CheR-type [Mariprofundus aestuarium]